MKMKDVTYLLKQIVDSFNVRTSNLKESYSQNLLNKNISPKNVKTRHHKQIFIRAKLSFLWLLWTSIILKAFKIDFI